MHNIQDFEAVIKKSDEIIIFSHINPDGDTLGSMIALAKLIELNIGKTPTAVIIGKTPETYSFMNFIDECKKQVPVVQTGIFGADMKVNLLNDGPVTIIIDSDIK